MRVGRRGRKNHFSSQTLFSCVSHSMEDLCEIFHIRSTSWMDFLQGKFFSFFHLSAWTDMCFVLVDSENQWMFSWKMLSLQPKEQIHMGVFT